MLCCICPNNLSTAETIADQLGLARSNVSNSIKELLSWGLIHRVPLLGDRRDHFAAETDIWEIVTRIAKGRKAREIDPAEAALRACTADAERGPRNFRHRQTAAESHARFRHHHVALARRNAAGAEIDLDDPDQDGSEGYALPRSGENQGRLKIGGWKGSEMGATLLQLPRRLPGTEAKPARSSLSRPARKRGMGRIACRGPTALLEASQRSASRALSRIGG
jgi:hypothetical protein